MTENAAEIYTIKEVPTSSIVESESNISKISQSSCYNRSSRSTLCFLKDYYNGFYGAFAFVVCITSCIPIILIPIHDNVKNPEFWFDVILSSPPVIFFIVASIVVRAQTILNCFNETMTRIILDIFCTSFFSEVAACSLLHLIWTTFLGYLEPVPWKCVWIGYVLTFVLVIRFWYSFPKELIKDASFRKRRRAYFRYIAWISFVGIQLIGLSKLFKEMPRDIQWLLGIVVPLLKEINDRFSEKMISNASTCKNITDSKLVAKVDLGIMFSFWLTILLATVATQITGYVLLGINSFINLALCLKARYLERKTCSSIGEAMKNHSSKREVVAELVLNETIESLKYLQHDYDIFQGFNQTNLSYM